MMLDVNGNEFKPGQVIVCYDPIEDFMTYGKVYTLEALRPEEDRVVIIDDRGKEGWFKAERFEVVVP